MDCVCFREKHLEDIPYWQWSETPIYNSQRITISATSSDLTVNRYPDLSCDDDDDDDDDDVSLRLLKLEQLRTSVPKLRWLCFNAITMWPEIISTPASMLPSTQPASPSSTCPVLSISPMQVACFLCESIWSVRGNNHVEARLARTRSTGAWAAWRIPQDDFWTLSNHSKATWKYPGRTLQSGNNTCVVCARKKLQRAHGTELPQISQTRTTMHAHVERSQTKVQVHLGSVTLILTWSCSISSLACGRYDHSFNKSPLEVPDWFELLIKPQFLQSQEEFPAKLSRPLNVVNKPWTVRTNLCFKTSLYHNSGTCAENTGLVCSALFVMIRWAFSPWKHVVLIAAKFTVLALPFESDQQSHQSNSKTAVYSIPTTGRLVVKERLRTFCVEISKPDTNIQIFYSWTLFTNSTQFITAPTKSEPEVYKINQIATLEEIDCGPRSAVSTCIQGR